MAKNKRISELILEIEFGINKIDVKSDTIVKSTNINIKKAEKKSNDNMLRLEKAFFNNFSNEIHSKFD